MTETLLLFKEAYKLVRDNNWIFKIPFILSLLFFFVSLSYGYLSGQILIFSSVSEINSYIESRSVLDLASASIFGYGNIRLGFFPGLKVILDSFVKWLFLIPLVAFFKAPSLILLSFGFLGSAPAVVYSHNLIMEVVVNLLSLLFYPLLIAGLIAGISSVADGKKADFKSIKSIILKKYVRIFLYFLILQFIHLAAFFSYPLLKPYFYIQILSSLPNIIISLAKISLYFVPMAIIIEDTTLGTGIKKSFNIAIRQLNKYFKFLAGVIIFGYPVYLIGQLLSSLVAYTLLLTEIKDVGVIFIRVFVHCIILSAGVLFYKKVSAEI